MCYRFLALASQSLSIIFELIPYVRETFRRHLSQKQAVMLVEFDKLKRVRGTLLVEILYSPLFSIHLGLSRASERDPFQARSYHGRQAECTHQVSQGSHMLTFQDPVLMRFAAILPSFPRLVHI